MAIPKKRILPFVVLLVAAAVAATAFDGPLRRLLFGGNPTDAIRVAGNIEVIDADLSFKIPGKVLTRPVDEGEPVEAGKTVIATLETQDLEAELALREAEAKAAEAVLEELRNGARQEEKDAALAAMQKAYFFAEELVVGSRPQQVHAATAEYEAAKADLRRLELDLRRAEQLIASRAISQEVFDRARAAYDVGAERLRQASAQLSLVTEGARAQQIDQAMAALDQATAQCALVINGPRAETIRQAEAKLAQAQAAVAIVKTKLSYATIVAPLTGVVLSKNVEPGEYVAPGTPVVTVGDVVNCWLRAYITAGDLPRVKLGQKARVIVDSRSGKSYEGRVSFIAANSEFTPKNVQTEKERVKLVYRIKIDVHNPSQELKPGMPADAEILVHE
jgi:HlyD family secretion protein